MQNSRELSFDSWTRKIPWNREWQLTPVFLPASMDRGAWHMVHEVVKELDTTQLCRLGHQFH